MARVRTKKCFKCSKQMYILYRCKYDEIKDWVFFCEDCLKKIKSLFENTYKYGGTWKSKKKQRLPKNTTKIKRKYEDTLMF